MTTTVEAKGPVDVTVRLEPVAWLSPASEISPPLAYSNHEMDDEYRNTYTPLYAIPEGWQLVPKEPTDAMVKAALASYFSEDDMECDLNPENVMSRLVGAAIAAALTPNEQGQRRP